MHDKIDLSQSIEEETNELYKYRPQKGDYETGLNRDERYILNKIRYEYLKKMQTEKENE